MSRNTLLISSLSFLFLFSTQSCQRILTHAIVPLGQWIVLQNNAGISAMHMQLLHNDRVIMFDRTDFGQSNISLSAGRCRNDPSELALKTDCTAHSIEYNVLTNTLRPLMVQTDTWCSSGSVMPDGRLFQTGGFNDGDRNVRIFTPCNNNACDWVEVSGALNVTRWYATNQLLPDGRQIIIGGIGQNNYEFYPKTATSAGTYDLSFLAQTYDNGILDNLYPFVYLCPDGNLFIFSNNRAILLNYQTNTVVKNYPIIPGGDPRNYPSTGSAVLLPLKNLDSASIVVEVLVCGGAPTGSYVQAIKGNFIGALNTCARMRITDPIPQWVMETMPLPRVMGDMTLLPNGNALIINGGSSGTAAWELGRDPIFNPVMYRPDNALGTRFQVLNSSTIPRMYHSTAVLLRDGRVLVGGSNPHSGYDFSGVLFPTELRLEAFYPPYLDASYDSVRPNIVSPKRTAEIGYGQKLVVQFQLLQVVGGVDLNMVSVTMVSPSFTTHSFSVNHRLLVLTPKTLTKIGTSTYEIQVLTPPSAVVAPSGYYMVFVVHHEIPSRGIWIHIK